MKENDPYHFSSLFAARQQSREQQRNADEEHGSCDAGRPRSQHKRSSCTSSRSAKARQTTPQEHVIVHVKAGEMYRAFIKLVHKAAATAHVQDESLPHLSEDVAPYRYIVIRPGQPVARNGFCRNLAPEMLVRRVCTTKPAFYRLQTHPNADEERSMCVNTSPVSVDTLGALGCILREGVAQEDSLLCRDMIARRGVHLHHVLVKRILNMHPRSWAQAPRLTPAAIPVSLFSHVEAQIATHNAKLPPETQLQVYLEDALRKPAAIVSIQSAWRSCLGREGLNLTERVLHHRAALCIQRAWRSHLFLSHLRCLDAASALMDSMAAMTLIPTLCLTLLSARMIGLASQRKAGCLPMQSLQWGYLSNDRGVVILVHSDSTRLGIPKWLQCEIPAVPWELASVRGHPLMPSKTEEDRRQLLQMPRWASLKWLVHPSTCQLDLKYPVSGSNDCVGLLQKNVHVKQAQAAAVSELDMEGMMPDAVLRMLTFSTPDEARRRALLLFFVTWDPAYDQAAELVPICLSTAMSQHQAGINKTLYNDGNDEDTPALPIFGESDENDVLRRRMALVIALSLPGTSKLAPYIHTIAGGQTSPTPVPGDPPGTSRHKSTIKSGPRSSMAKRPSTFQFLQKMPDSFDIRQDQGRNLLLQVDRNLDPGYMCSPGAVPASPTPNREHQWLQSPHAPTSAPLASHKTPLYLPHTAQTVDATNPGARVSSKGVEREKIHSAAVATAEDNPGDDLVVAQTSTGTIQRASKSIAEVEIGQVIMELGPENVQEPGIYQALAGAFGRLQQSEHEAFLHMRTADLLTRKRVIVEAVQQMPSMMPRHTAVGHALAPGYVPATMATMSRSVHALKKIWNQRNEKIVDTIKEARKLALKSMHDEILVRQAARYNARCQERAHAAAVFADNSTAQKDAARHRTAIVKARKRHSRAAVSAKIQARSIGASVAAEARRATHVDRYIAVKRKDELKRQQAEDRWEAKLTQEEEADFRQVQQLQLKKTAAAAVRDSGYTSAVHEVYAAKYRERCQQVSRDRMKLQKGKAMVGSGGGVWGSCPPQVLLEPYPTTTIVAASENEDPEQRGGAEDQIAAFADIQPHMIKRVYNDFFTFTAGMDGTFAAKVAFGSYVGLPDIPFGTTALRQGK